MAIVRVAVYIDTGCDICILNADDLTREFVEKINADPELSVSLHNLTATPTGESCTCGRLER